MPWRRFLERQAEADAEKARRAATLIEDLQRLSTSLTDLTDELAELYLRGDDDRPA